ncbi:hypothetical protein ACFYNO_17050 [Kitasatospora sp. NPDC006697]|uniref:hypothetical protein n=1 Tax=Kitasatospora sp. NPDC006697 TaxID=3364020 RepID=UPI0036D0F4C6
MTGRDRRSATPAGFGAGFGYLSTPRPAAAPAAAPDPAPGLPGGALPDLKRLYRAPAPYGAEHAQACHELDLAATLVLAQPEAATSLTLLTDSPARIHPGGALVLAALLHLTGYADACQFWLQFAAGGGNPTAASLLSLQHASRGEHRDAHFWRGRAEQLAAEPPAPAQTSCRLREPLPAALWTATLAACHDGLTLNLPPRVAAVVHQLPVDRDDEDHGEIPQPSRTLVDDLARAAGADRA